MCTKARRNRAHLLVSQSEGNSDLPTLQLMQVLIGFSNRILLLAGISVQSLSSPISKQNLVPSGGRVREA